MVFAEAEANAVTDELAARSTIRERQREPQKIELLERDGEDPMALGMAINPTTSLPLDHDEDEEMQFEIRLNEEVMRALEGTSGPVEKHELPILLDLDFNSKAAEDTVDEAVLPSEPAEPEAAAEPSPHPPTIGVTPTSTSDIAADQPKEEPEEAAASTQVKSDDGLETTPPIPTETTTTTTDIPLAGDDNVSIPEPPSIPEEIRESVCNQDVATTPDDQEMIIPTSVINDDESRIVAVPVVADEAPPDLVVPEVGTKLEPESEPEKIDEVSLEEVPADKAQPEVAVDVGKPVVEDVGSAATKEDKGGGGEVIGCS